MSRIDYVDREGIKRRVLLPADSGSPPDEGIPISVPVDALYGHMPLAFRIALVDALWAVDMIEFDDFLRPGAAQVVQAALLSVVRHDALDMIAFAKEGKRDG